MDKLKNGQYCENGTICWYKNGELHRDDGPTLIYEDGTQFWYKNGLLYREDGPAVIFTDGTEYWYMNGVLHRVDGPALVRSDGSGTYFLYGKMLIKEEWWNILTAEEKIGAIFNGECL